MDDQMTNNKSKQAPVAGQVNGENVVAQLDQLLDRFDNLDENTLQALENLFKRYKSLRPTKLENVSNAVGSFFNEKFPIGGRKNGADEKKNAATPQGKPGAPQVTPKPGNTAASSKNGEEVEKMLEEHEGKLAQQCRAAERALCEAKTQYAYQKKVLAVYEETVVPLLSPFNKVMQNLSYFAACADPVLYEEGKTPLRNKSQMLRTGMQPGMWGEVLDGAHMEKIGEMFRVTCPNNEFTFVPESAAEVKTRIMSYKSREEAANKQRQPYDTENAKLANQIKHAEQLWEYAGLLRSFLPQLERISSTPEDAECAAWATEIGTALLSAVEHHTCRNPDMTFHWVYPHGELSRKSEKIRVQFIAAELDCPGLYYSVREENDSGRRYVCVAPGYAKE